MSIYYRADIDGLRAVAVLGVISYHVGALGVSGGFVGVDVFFVISGYLITGIVAREIAAGQFSLLRFYDRRIRRILPALAAVVVISSIVSAVILFPADFEEYGQSVLSLAIFASNFHFARKTGYFDGAADEKPLLHTWSLAVEEQFYIVFPLLLLMLFRWRRQEVVPLLILAALISLLVGAEQTARMPERAFYSSIARSWELLLGALCALGSWSMPWPKAARECAAAGGFALIAGAYWLFSDATPFPGLYALVPCLGAALLILAGQGGETFVGRVLSLPAIAGIGLISYSAYLWHWPLLVFLKYRFSLMPDADLRLGLALIVASIGLGYLSWRFIEQPFRKPAGGGGKASFGFAAGFLAASASVGLLVVRSEGIPGRWPDKLAAVTAKNRRDPDCRPAPESSGWPAGACLLGGEGAQFDTLIWGDSHAAMLSSEIAKGLTRANRGAVLVTTGGCPPLFSVTLYGRGKKEICRHDADRVEAKLAEGEVRRVVLVARWALYAEGERLAREGGQPVRLTWGKEGNPAVFEQLLGETVRRLMPLVDQTVVIGPIPEVDFQVGQAMARKIAWNQPLPPATAAWGFRTAPAPCLARTGSHSSRASRPRRLPGSLALRCPRLPLCEWRPAALYRHEPFERLRRPATGADVQRNLRRFGQLLRGVSRAFCSAKIGRIHRGRRDTFS